MSRESITSRKRVVRRAPCVPRTKTAAGGREGLRICTGAYVPRDCRHTSGSKPCKTKRRSAAYQTESAKSETRNRSGRNKNIAEFSLHPGVDPGCFFDGLAKVKRRPTRDSYYSYTFPRRFCRCLLASTRDALVPAFLSFPRIHLLGILCARFQGKLRTRFALPLHSAPGNLPRKSFQTLVVVRPRMFMQIYVFRNYDCRKNINL